MDLDLFTDLSLPDVTHFVEGIFINEIGYSNTLF